MPAARSLVPLAFTVLLTLPASPQPPTRKPAPVPATTQLPVTRVSLYKNGVGFFEHAGHVTGSQSVTIDFTTAQLNDVLQSLTAIDLNGGRIAGADYNSTTPLDQQLRSLPLGLDQDPTTVNFYNAIRGARIEVHAGAATITGRLLNIEVTEVPAANNQPASQKRLITVISDAGEVRTLELTPTTTVRLLDPDLHTDVTRYLQLLAGTRNQGLRHLTLQDNAPPTGTGPRELHVSYISEVPIWKSTYRILFTDPKASSPTTSPTTPSPIQTATLQGWSVVDNTTGEDWLNVHLSLIAGAPQSFIQPLSQPIYSRRPEIPIAQNAQLTPQTHESGEQFEANGISGIQGRIFDSSGAAIANARVTATNTSTGVQLVRTSDGSGNYTLSPLQSGNYNVEIIARGFQRLLEENVQVSGTSTTRANFRLIVGQSQTTTVTVTDAPPNLDTRNATLGGTISNQLYTNLPLSMGGAPRDPSSFQSIESGLVEGKAADSFNPNASTTATFDDYFAYNLTDPITIRKNESALVPILQTKIDAERVTLVSFAAGSPRQPTPLRALWITNTSALTLDRGSFSIVEDGNFGGEGLLDPIHPAEKRLLSYAVDQAVRVTTEASANTSRVTSITASKGVLILHNTAVTEITYVVHNAAPEPRTVVVEHPIHQNYTLDSAGGSTDPAPKPYETTPTLYRFRVPTAPGESVRLHVGERRPSTTTYELTRSDDNQFTVILNQTRHNPALEAALQPILAARHRVAESQSTLDTVNARLSGLRSDEERQRANVTALATADKASRNRFIHDLNATEDQITSTQNELAIAQTALQAARDDLSTRIETLQINETL